MIFTLYIAIYSGGAIVKMLFEGRVTSVCLICLCPYKKRFLSKYNYTQDRRGRALYVIDIEIPCTIFCGTITLEYTPGLSYR